MLLQFACQSAGVSFGLHSAKDGEKAIAYLAGEGIYADRASYPVPDLVLLDLKMPFKSGYEVLVWIRNQPHLKLLPVVVFTGGTRESDIERAYKLGANEFLVKTGKLEQLKEMALALESVLADERVNLKAVQGLGASKGLKA
jgi:CheY-like chemotaxis protein